MHLTWNFLSKYHNATVTLYADLPDIKSVILRVILSLCVVSHVLRSFHFRMNNNLIPNLDVLANTLHIWELLFQ